MKTYETYEQHTARMHREHQARQDRYLCDWIINTRAELAKLIAKGRKIDPKRGLAGIPNFTWANQMRSEAARLRSQLEGYYAVLRRRHESNRAATATHRGFSNEIRATDRRNTADDSKR